MRGFSKAAVALGDRAFELRELELPRVGDADGLLRVEACGVCGSDLKKYARSRPATILGHEAVGHVERVGETASERWGVAIGDRVLPEEYLPCGHCRICRQGDFRSCHQTDNERGEALRYGSTPVSVPPGLWGGYSQYQYLHPSSVLHAVPEHVASQHAALAIPLSNGIQWTQVDAGVGPGDVVVIQGPGQQGMSCLLAAKAVGAEMVVVCGLAQDADRLATAGKLGADEVVDLTRQDLSTVLERTSDGMADVVIDCSGAGADSLSQALQVVGKRGRIVMASGGSTRSATDLDLGLIRKKQLRILGVRGHSYEAVERAIKLIARGESWLDAFAAVTYPLDRIGEAFETAANPTESQPLHMSILPWS